MNEKKAVKLYNGITGISEEIIEEAQTVRARGKLPVWTRWAAAAACVCLVVVGVLVWKQPWEPLADADMGSSRITVSEDGVTIAPMDVTLSSPSSNAEEADMIGFFIYQGRCYVQYEWIYDDVDLIGEHLGTATGLIDEWTPEDGYVELAGSVKGDFYSVKGFDPSFMLCMKQDDGSVATYICNTGITLKTGYDLYEERIHLSENYYAVQYETRASWYDSAGEVYQLNDPKSETLTAFLQALNAAEFMPTADVPSEEGETYISSREVYHMYFLMENGMSVHLRLYKGGYVCFQGLLDVCVQVPEAQFDAMTALLADPAAGVLAEQYDYSLSLEDCRRDESFGSLIPTHVPDGMSFERATIRYFLDSATGSETGTREIWLCYSSTLDPSVEYSIGLTWADDYGTNGWAGPMLDHSELSEAALAEYVETESATGKPMAQSQILVGVWYDQVAVVMIAYGLDAETAYQILSSIESR